MADHQHAVAKVAFIASMLAVRPDPTAPPSDRHDVTRFLSLLDALTSKCSSENVQLCKTWLLKHMTSPTRVEALGKYLTFLSNSFADLEDEKTRQRSSGLGSSNKRKRLHLLFLVNDLLHHAKFHERDSTAWDVISSRLQPYLERLVKLAASFDAAKNRKFHQEIADLLDLWKENGYYDVRYLDSLKTAAKIAPSENTLDIDKAMNADAPFMMPARHGRPNVPYYDLPAGNMIPHIIPNSSAPIPIRQMKALQFTPGPADDRLAKAVKDFLKDVDDIYRPILHDDEGIVADIDKMGQAMTKDEKTGELTVKHGYYGWSIAFCEQMRKKRSEPQRQESFDKTGNDDMRGRGRGLSRHRSPSRSSSRSRSDDRGRISFKRSYSSSRSPSRGGSGRYSRDRSISRSRPAQRPRYDRRSHSRDIRCDRSRERSRDRSWDRRPRLQSRSRSRSPGSYRNRAEAERSSWKAQPAPLARPPDAPHMGSQSFSPSQQSPPVFTPTPPAMSAYPNPYIQGFPMAPGGAPPPPPPPPGNFNGVWPFPPYAAGYPPPMPPQNAAFPPSSSPPPPPPPQYWQQQHQPRNSQDYSSPHAQQQQNSPHSQWQQGQYGQQPGGHAGGYGYRGGGGGYRGGRGWGR